MNKLFPALMLMALTATVNPAHATSVSAKKAQPAHVALVNGEPVLQDSVDYMLESRAKHGDFIDERLRQRVREELETQTLLAQQLEKTGADKTPQIIAQMDLARLAIMSKAYLDAYFKEHPVTPEILKAEYEKKKAAGELREYHLRNILLKTEKDAQEVAQKLRAGADFATLAKAKSLDPGANTNGGDIGWVRPDIFIDLHFADAVKTLQKPGDYTPEPVPTRFGWNLLKLEEGPRQVRKLPNFGDLPNDTTKVMRDIKMQRMLEDMVSKLRAKAKITS